MLPVGVQDIRKEKMVIIRLRFLASGIYRPRARSSREENRRNFWLECAVLLLRVFLTVSPPRQSGSGSDVGCWARGVLYPGGVSALDLETYYVLLVGKRHAGGDGAPQPCQGFYARHNLPNKKKQKAFTYVALFCLCVRPDHFDRCRRYFGVACALCMLMAG